MRLLTKKEGALWYVFMRPTNSLHGDIKLLSTASITRDEADEKMALWPLVLDMSSLAARLDAVQHAQIQYLYPTMVDFVSVICLAVRRDTIGDSKQLVVLKTVAQQLLEDISKFEQELK